jgi:hypothetical protein
MILPLLAAAGVCLASDAAPSARLEAQWEQYQAEVPKSILALQPFRTESRAGPATWIDLAPAVNVWFLLSIEVPGSTLQFHIENPEPHDQQPRLVADPSGALEVTGLAGAEPCELWQSGARNALGDAAGSGLPYAPLCGGRLYLRNAVAGHRTSIERITDFLRDHIYGGEEIISLVKEHAYRDAFREQGSAGPGACAAPGAPADRPLAAEIDAAESRQCIVPGSFGLDTEAGPSGMAPGLWYAVRDLPGVYASTVMPQELAARLSSGPLPHVARLDRTESAALVYLVAFDLEQLELHFALGTDHPRLDWSPRPPEQMLDARLPGPDGIASAAPLVRNGMVSPAEVDRTVATFAGGFKREHGAFRYGPLALVDHGSHYGFIEEGTIFSKLQPGLATLIVSADGRVDMKTWTSSDDAALATIRYARQNGVPLLQYDPARHAAVPGALVNLWGPGNWSGSASEVLRTLRAGACLEETPAHRFLVYGYFSSATPSAMARVFMGYGCRYAMQLDINALEHTYLALYVHREHERLVEHLVQGMEQCDGRSREGLAPRFLAVPDDRDFFYFTRLRRR